VLHLHRPATDTDDHRSAHIGGSGALAAGFAAMVEGSVT
jgi:hypothetical protein